MRICDFKIFSYHLPLARPLPGAARGNTERKGHIIQLTDENGQHSYGETAPLAGVSVEMPDIVLEQLRELRSQLLGQPIPNGIGEKGSRFSDLYGKISLSPSVKFGIETAVLSLRALQQKKSLAALITEDYQPMIILNGLLSGSQDDVLSQARDFLSNGYHTLKLKVGTLPLKDDIQRVNRLTELSHGKAVLRLDANKAWSFEEALEFTQGIDFGAIEYLEEPLKDFREAPRLYEETLIPIAIDESLQNHSLREIKSFDGVETVILKPTLLGGFEKIGQLAEEAHAYGLHTVITSTFESSIGLRALANLAACYSKHNAVGLDTQSWFKGDVTAPLKSERGKLAVDNCGIAGLKLDPAFTQEIA